MKPKKVKLTIIVESEDEGYVSLCPELDVASQGDTVDEAIHNVKEAIRLFLSCASESELNDRLSKPTLVKKAEFVIGNSQGTVWA